jgi:hypothetical protein
MASRKRTYVGRVYLGHGRYKWVGRFPTKKARDMAVAAARVELNRGAGAPAITCDEWADRYLDRYQRDRKASSTDKTRSALRRFGADSGDRTLGSIARIEAMDLAERVPLGAVAAVVTMFNAAVDAELIERKPFRGLGHRGKDRSEQHPPTEEELSRLLAACAVHMRRRCARCRLHRDAAGRDLRLGVGRHRLRGDADRRSSAGL